MKVWAFNKAEHESVRKKVYQSIKDGKSRFGWSQEDKHNLKLKDNWSDWHSKQLFLLKINPGDWIVHVNTPEYGKCIAAKVESDYDFDEGIECDWGKDFRHHFKIDVDSIIEFDRKDPNILPSVNLNPRQRYHRVYAEEDFIESIQNLKSNKVSLGLGESRSEFHLKKKTQKFLVEIAKTIHKMNKSKELERFLAKVFKEVPGVVDVVENGFGWGTDHGADLIVTMSSGIGYIEFEERIIVQIKSFEGKHFNLNAVEQVKNGIEQYEGSAGMIITTARKTEELEDKILQVSEEIGCPIDLLAGEDVAKFVIKHTPELVFELM